MAKCYMFVCGACRLLAESTRSDALTCSTACRVKAKRTGALEPIRQLADEHRVTPAAILRAMAVDRLRPDLAEMVLAGRRDMDSNEVAKPVRAEFLKLLYAQAEAKEEH